MKTNTPAVLNLDGFGVSFGKRVVLDGITLCLLPDGIEVLMGPVKAGKSTLLRTLSGLYDGHPLHKSWGNVTVAGQPMSQTNRPALLQQHATVFALPLLEVLLQPIRAIEQRSPAEWREQGLVWLAQYGLNEAIEQFNQPLLSCSTRIQRSVLILAQVLLKPPLLMIDEPTYGLNDADATWLIDWLKKISVNCKLLVVLHNQVQARRLADKIILIGGGRVLAHQDTQAFFQRPANEYVETFIRSGSLSLPSPDARPEELETGVAPPPVLSQAARVATQTSMPEPVDIPEPVVISKPVVIPPAPPVVAPPVDMPFVTATPVIRAPIQLPAPSRDDVELASMVGEVMMRNSSAPRGFNWIVPGKLAGCPAPGVSAPIDYDMDLLARVGITRLITLTEVDLDQDALCRHGLTNIHLPIFDREAPSIGQTHMLLARMQRFIAAGDVLAVHCKAGLGRTGTILAAWLIRYGGLSATGAIERLRRIEPGFIQSAMQEEFLHLYEADITNRMI